MDDALVSIATHAVARPHKAAVVQAITGRVVTFDELNVRSLALAKALRQRGLLEGSHLAILMDNTVDYFEVAWAAQRSGLYYTPVNWHLTPRESYYIIEDAGAQAIVASPELITSLSACASKLSVPGLALVAGEPTEGFEGIDEFVQSEHVDDIVTFDETEGSYMFYSSGTTGMPKGIKRETPQVPFGTAPASDSFMKGLFGFSDETIYLCPAPLYHAAPLGWSMLTQRLGGTVILMERFDPVELLQLIERHRVTHVQMVPTMFVRLLKLPEEVRHGYDLSSLEMVAHAAAPCPVAVKEQMLEWWGPIIREYYAGSESTSFFTIGAQEWREHRGAVGRNLLGAVHILDDDGNELAPGEVGTVWFESAQTFEYHNDPAKTSEAFNDHGWNTLGDMGSMRDGYLYLSDRRTNLILSGGTNIYPQEIEDVLALHPEVQDVAVIGVPDEDLGQRVVAVVTPSRADDAGPELAQRLIDYCRERLAHFKCPRDVYFDDDLPRLPTGKLAKRMLRERYPA